MPLYSSQPIHPGYIAGRIYPTARISVSVSSAVAAADVIYLYAFMMSNPITFTGGQARVQTGGAGSSGKFAIWANSPVSMRPLGAPLFVDATGVATATSSTTVAVAIGSGSLNSSTVYWVGSKYTGTLPVLHSQGGVDHWTSWLIGGTGPHITAYSFADAYANAMPTFSEGAAFTASASAIPLLWLAT